MSGSWWATKMRRFGRYFFGRVTETERAELTRWLTPAQLALFESMHRADQRHGLDVVRALRADHQIDRDLLLAGLLHDCGKGRGLHVWHRVGWSLTDRYGPRVGRIMVAVPTFKAAFQVIASSISSAADANRLPNVVACAATLWLRPAITRSR